MRILLTNDDGIDYPGLSVLAESLAAEHQISIVAPAQDRSGTSAGIILRETITIEKKDWTFFTADGKKFIQPQAYTVNATPGSCVLLGVSGGWLQPPDLVVSGINPGPNMGLDTYISGTIGAARVANILGLPAIAVSVGFSPDEREWRVAAAFVRFFINWLFDHQYLGRPPILWNINLPKDAEKVAITYPGNSSLVQGLTFDIQDFPAQVRIDTRRQYTNGVPPSGAIRKDSPPNPQAEERHTPGESRNASEESALNVSRYESHRLDPNRFVPGTDIWAYRHGYISISPLTLEAKDPRNWLNPSLTEELLRLSEKYTRNLGEVN